MRNTRSALMAATVLSVVAGMGALAEALPAPRKGGNRDYKPNPPRMDSALAREIAEHNEAVARRKAEKMARKMAR